MKEVVLMSDSMRMMIERSGDKQRKTIYDMIQFYRKQFAAHVGRADAPSIAAAIHAFMDTMIEAHHAKRLPVEKQVSCKPGCSACCNLHVMVTPQEAILLALLVEERNLLIDHARLERQAKHGDVDGWNTLEPADRRCVLLNDAGMCNAYEFRPAACRKYFVVSPPSQCDTIKFPGATVQRLATPQAEIVDTAAVMALGSGPLATGLIAAFESADEEKARGETKP